MNQVNLFPNAITTAYPYTKIDPTGYVGSALGVYSLLTTNSVLSGIFSYLVGSFCGFAVKQAIVVPLKQIPDDQERFLPYLSTADKNGIPIYYREIAVLDANQTADVYLINSKLFNLGFIFTGIATVALTSLIGSLSKDHNIEDTLTMIIGLSFTVCVLHYGYNRLCIETQPMLHHGRA